MTDKEARTLWLQDNRLKAQYYAKYARVWRSYYNGTAQGIAEAALSDAVLLTDVITFEDTAKIFGRLYTDVGTTFAEGAFLTVKQQTGSVSEWEQSIAMYLANEGKPSIQSVYDTNIEQARKIISDITEQGIAEGLSVPELEALINRQVPDLWKIYGKWSAERIARTEVVAAGNYGSFIGAKSTGLSLRKVWLTAIDGRERAAHAQAMTDSQLFPVSVDSAFIVGGEELMFPGAKNGSPENVINCRCSVAYRSTLLD